MNESEVRILAVVLDKGSTRDDVAEVYAQALGEQDIDWVKVNRAIITQWSLGALGYIKDRAWKVAGG